MLYEDVRIGMKVVVTQRQLECDKWENSWVADMESYVGKIFTVSRIDGSGVRFKEDAGRFGFPWSALQLVGVYESPVCLKIRAMYARRQEQGYML